MAFFEYRHPLPADDLDQIVARTRTLWEEVRNRSIFISGGTGFVGTWLVESFLHANRTLGLNANVIVLTRDVARFGRKAPHLVTNSALRLIEGDVRRFTFPSGEYPFAIHAANDAAAPTNAPAAIETLAVVLDGTRQVLDFARRHGTRKLLLTSSGAVYGRAEGVTRIPEDFAGAPDPLVIASAYGEGKRLAEHACVLGAIQWGFEAKIARCFALIGPHLPLDGGLAASDFIRDALAGRSIRLTGDGTAVRSYLYAADMTEWLWTVLFRGESARAYNVGSSLPVTIAELAWRVATVAGVTVASAPSPNATPGRASACYIPAVNRAESELGLRPVTSLDDAIVRTLRWYQSHDESR